MDRPVARNSIVLDAVNGQSILFLLVKRETLSLSEFFCLRIDLVV